jgi:hypothetical protein
MTGTTWEPDLSKSGYGLVGPPYERVYGQVWHYTDLAGLVGIVESDALWATSLASLNDTSELEYGLSIIRAVWASCVRTALPDRAVELIDLALRDVPTGVEPSKVFVFSASKDSDLLNQWAHYGGAGGFALGISTTRKFEVQGREPFEQVESLPILDGWRAVLYDRESQEEHARMLLQNALQRFNTSFSGQGFDDAAATERIMLNTHAAFWKHPAFFGEQEVRYVTALPLDSRPKFRVSGSRLIPYVVLVPREADEEPVPFLVNELRLGPGVDAQTEANTRSLLEANGRGTLDVWRSEVPYASRRT